MNLRFRRRSNRASVPCPNKFRRREPAEQPTTLRSDSIQQREFLLNNRCQCNVCSARQRKTVDKEYRKPYCGYNSSFPTLLSLLTRLPTLPPEVTVPNTVVLWNKGAILYSLQNSKLVGSQLSTPELLLWIKQNDQQGVWLLYSRKLKMKRLISTIQFKTIVKRQTCSFSSQSQYIQKWTFKSNGDNLKTQSYQSSDPRQTRRNLAQRLLRALRQDCNIPVTRLEVEFDEQADCCTLTDCTDIIVEERQKNYFTELDDSVPIIPALTKQLQKLYGSELEGNRPLFVFSVQDKTSVKIFQQLYPQEGFTLNQYIGKRIRERSGQLRNFLKTAGVKRRQFRAQSRQLGGKSNSTRSVKKCSTLT